jgi:polysaccharide export outer membrane protein
MAAGFGHLFAMYLGGAMMRTLTSTLQLGVSVLLIACSTNSYGQNVASAKSNPAHVPANIPASANTIPNSLAATSQLILGPADIIRINVWKNMDLSQTVTVGPDGFISLPLLGDVHVAGMTSNQLAQELKSKLTSYVVNAQVTVSVVDIRSRQVYMTGQVGKPGGYPLIAPITVLQLIAQAGGLNTFANRKDIVILRSVGGNVQRLKFNYNNAVHGDPKQNISLQPGDTVIVP